MRVRPLTVGVLVLTLALTASGWVLARHSIERAEAAELERAAEEFESVVQLTVGPAEGTLHRTAAVAARPDLDDAVLEEVVGEEIDANPLYRSLAVVQLDEAGPRVVARRGSSSLLDSVLAETDTLAGVTTARTELLAVDPDPTLYSAALGLGADSSSGARLVYLEMAVPTQVMSAMGHREFGRVVFALYIESDPSNGEAALATTTDLPITERQIERTVELHGRPATIVAGVEDSLVGPFRTALPWVVLVVGLAAGTVMTVLVEAHGRRHHQVTHLSRKTGELHAALAEQRRIEIELSRRATHDSLTDLPNRMLFRERLDHAMRMSQRSGTTIAVLFVDLDRFKHINDTYGHTVGDAVLIGVADRLREAVRGSDTVARFGGDEFVLLCEDVDDYGGTLALTQRIEDAMDEPLDAEGVRLRVTASIGVTVGTGVSDSPEELLRDADTAMYRAKGRGKATIEVFDLPTESDSA